MSGRRRWGVIGAVAVVAAGIAIAIWAFRPRAVGIDERLRIVEHEAALSAIPPEATLIEADGNDCPDAPGVGPYFNWRYAYGGPQVSVFSFYDERLRSDGWDPVPPPPSDASTPRYPARHYAKSYGRWKARATVRFHSGKEFGLGVSVDDLPPKGCA